MLSQNMEQQLAGKSRVVAIGGGHGLGRVLSSLSFLGEGLTGIVATTDNGGSTGRLRETEDCIAWGDLRNCLSQVATRPSIGSLLFEYRFSGDTPIGGHNLGNLMLLALDQLCVRPLEAVNLIRNMLNIKPRIIPMSEQPTHLLALSKEGEQIVGELNVDAMETPPQSLQLSPQVNATCEACEAIRNAEVILLGPGSFYTSLMPVLLTDGVRSALEQSQAKVVFIDNIDAEQSPASQLSLQQRLDFCQSALGLSLVDHVVCHGDESRDDGIFHYRPMNSSYQPGRHDTKALASALEDILSNAR
ncbi:uridine diphosphate-N-acetylglucosamine-binding protein YvcK [Shewanella submarina]|uniref:Putative gluconeogenesis factor n=1 Tax=Shewanella submarina TaxID=2016376 RepID=A0ABV7GDA0_9GAMM|nr:uridine diphosphate-N-acetylglucosamine-binding protein YvcK [Shewanella submarina]MCL1039236.1 uridine diphosphate-N-acetylglucosamine-binding protein YvcK [Shewanella submarina]